MVVIYLAITDNQPESYHQEISLMQSWGIALRDRLFLIFLLVNIFFTTYLAHINSIMPLYFTNFVSGFSQGKISFLFAFHIIFASLLQMPIARFLNRFSRTRALIFSMLLWGIGFILIWLTGFVQTGNFVWAMLAMAVLAIATVAYNPAASSLVVELAPEQSRGIYLSLNSQCWAIGYFISPVLGGWVLERSLALRLPQSALLPNQKSHFLIDTFWLVNALSVILGVLVLMYLERKIKQSNN